MDQAGTRRSEAPRSHARLTGVFYLLTFVTGAAAVPAARLVVTGNAAATSVNILARPSTFRSGFVAYLLNVAVYIVVTVLLYRLFSRGGRTLSRMAAFLSLTGCAVQAAALAFYLAPLVVLGSAPYLAAFSLPQRQALALLFLELHAQVYSAGLALFGVYCLLLGVLILRSALLPRLVGVLMVLAGVAWLTNLWPPLAAALAPYNMAVGVLGEAALTVWLLVRGVDRRRWEAAGVFQERADILAT